MGVDKYRTFVLSCRSCRGWKPAPVGCDPDAGETTLTVPGLRLFSTEDLAVIAGPGRRKPQVFEGIFDTLYLNN